MQRLYIGRASELSIGGHGHAADNRLYWDARAYLATRIDPRAEGPLIVAAADRPRQAARLLLSMVPGESAKDTFGGVEFTWRLLRPARRGDGDGDGTSGRGRPKALALSFDAEHTDVALGEYLRFVMAEVEAQRRQDSALRIFHEHGPGLGWHQVPAPGHV